MLTHWYVISYLLCWSTGTSHHGEWPLSLCTVLWWHYHSWPIGRSCHWGSGPVYSAMMILTFPTHWYIMGEWPQTMCAVPCPLVHHIMGVALNHVYGAVMTLALLNWYCLVRTDAIPKLLSTSLWPLIKGWLGTPPISARYLTSYTANWLPTLRQNHS